MTKLRVIERVSSKSNFIVWMLSEVGWAQRGSPYDRSRGKPSSEPDFRRVAAFGRPPPHTKRKPPLSAPF
jgi:hypothetical protein